MRSPNWISVIFPGTLENVKILFICQRINFYSYSTAINFISCVDVSNYHLNKRERCEYSHLPSFYASSSSSMKHYIKFLELQMLLLLAMQLLGMRFRHFFQVHIDNLPILVNLSFVKIYYIYHVWKTFDTKRICRREN